MYGQQGCMMFYRSGLAIQIYIYMYNNIYIYTVHISYIPACQHFFVVAAFTTSTFPFRSSSVLASSLQSGQKNLAANGWYLDTHEETEETPTDWRIQQCLKSQQYQQLMVKCLGFGSWYHWYGPSMATHSKLKSKQAINKIQQLPCQVVSELYRSISKILQVLPWCPGNSQCLAACSVFEGIVWRCLQHFGEAWGLAAGTSWWHPKPSWLELHQFARCVGGCTVIGWYKISIGANYGPQPWWEVQGRCRSWSHLDGTLDLGRWILPL